jgi:hypothetical protein
LIVVTLLCSGIANANSYSGPATPVGNGTAHLVVRTNAANQPVSLSLVLDDAALRGLPPNEKKDGMEWEYLVPMPPGPKTAFNHVVADWNPHGHIPPGIYTFPHFDFHFYVIDRKHQIAVAFPKQEKDPAARVTNTAIVPKGYQVVPETVSDRMGVHAINPASPEFHGKRFTATFIYGYYKNRLIFIEPMITRKFLLSRTNATYSIPTPKAYSFPGYYPTSYSVRYDAARHAHIIELSGFKHFS